MSDFSTATLRWQALTSRNPLAQNAFIYSVITTKIYCRPTCPSRLARRSNVIFHNSPQEAEKEGFRACMRCKPGTLQGEELDSQLIAVEKAKTLLRSEGERKWNVKALAKEVGLTESHFCRVFKKIEGVTIGAYRIKIKEGMQDFMARPRGKELTGVDWADTVGSELPGWPCRVPTILDNSELSQIWDSFNNVPNSEIFFQQLSTGFNHIDLDFETMEGLTPDLVSDLTSLNTTEDCLQFLDFDSQLSDVHGK